jgi:tripartite-type tricarboxylate transporter receptor subunit TctC
MNAMCRRLHFTLLALMLALCAPAWGQTYPDHPVRLLVPYPPGAFNDTLARALAAKLSAAWGQPVVVENRPGGGTIIGTALAAKAPRDGYTLLVVSFAFAVNPALYTSLPYDSERDFLPVVLAASTSNLLVVNPALPATTAREFVALARSKPGRLNYASAGNGSSNHLSMELLKNMASLNLVHVPYKGSVPAVTDLIGGQVDAMFDNVPNVIQHVKSGRLRALAVSSATRSPFLPQVPTIAESGVPGFDVSVWFGIVAPMGTPNPVIARINAEVNRALKAADVVRLFGQQGVEPRGGTAAQFGELIRAQTEKWAAVVRDAGVTAD